MHHHYKPARFHFTEHQLKKIGSGHTVRLGHHQIGKGPHTLYLHPVQHHKVSMAHSKGKGVDLTVSDGELGHTIDSGAEGTGIWDSIKSGLSTAWKYVKPVLSGVGDAIAYSNPELAPLREGVRGITGVGLKRAHTKKSKKKMPKHSFHQLEVVPYESESDTEYHRAPHTASKMPGPHGSLHKVAHRGNRHKASHGNGLYL